MYRCYCGLRSVLVSEDNFRSIQHATGNFHGICRDLNTGQTEGGTLPIVQKLTEESITILSTTQSEHISYIARNTTLNYLETFMRCLRCKAKDILGLSGWNLSSIELS